MRLIAIGSVIAVLLSAAGWYWCNRLPPTEFPIVGCVQDSDFWKYDGMRWPWEEYRDHTIILNEEVPEGTVVWAYLRYDLVNPVDLELSGEDAGLFRFEYVSDYQTHTDAWRAVPVSDGMELVLWYKTKRPDIREYEFGGYWILTLAPLSEGEYKFTLPGDYREICEEQQFTVIVDRNYQTVPPAPQNIQVSRSDKGWTITWDPIAGVERYWIAGYTENNTFYGFDEEFTEDPEYHVGSHFVGYIEIWPLGDGEMYFNDFSVSSERITLGDVSPQSRQ